MLNEREKAGVRDFLSLLDADTVRSLVDTVTRRAITTTSLAEATDAIILHIESTASFFCRRRLTRDVLLRYLNTREIPVPGQASKLTLVQVIIAYWNQQPGPQDSRLAPGAANQHQPLLQHAQQPFQDHQLVPVAGHQLSTLNAANPMANMINPMPGTSFQNVANLVENVVSPQQGVPEPTVDAADMALEFTKWFYGILANISRGDFTAGSLEASFWNDVRCTVTLRSPDGEESRDARGSEQAAQMLTELLWGQQLFLNPNLNGGGVVGRLSRHGLAVVAVCGTTHQTNSCNGIFEQAFGLLQDPSSEFSWKIKWSQLRITRASVQREPQVTDLPDLMAICDNNLS